MSNSLSYTYSQEQIDQAMKRIEESCPNFIFNEQFSGWRNKMSRTCKICGDTRSVQARRFIEKVNGTTGQCAKCSNIKKGKALRKSNDDFLKELFKINPDIVVNDSYVNNNTKINVECKKCGTKWMAKPHVLLQGHGCSECAILFQNRFNKEEFLIMLQEKQSTVELIGEYIKYAKSTKFRCKICGYEWTTPPNHQIHNQNPCQKCVGRGIVSESEFIDRLSKSDNDRVIYLNGYDGIVKNCRFKCVFCSYEWNATPINILKGRGCPICNMSHGEYRVKKYLDNRNLKYETQKYFKGLKDIAPLKFDFYIESKNMCIEYDGEQHFIPSRFSRTMTDEDLINNLNDLKRRDKLKTDYCKDNNITLIRIPYTDFNKIDDILDKYLT